MTLARVQRFYGGDPERLIHMPMGILRMLTKAIPRLSAEESLTQVQNNALGAGTVRPHLAQALITRMSFLAGHETKKVQVSKSGLAALGIGYKVKGDGTESR